jgi:PAS domain S-box-containing protein
MEDLPRRDFALVAEGIEAADVRMLAAIVDSSDDAIISKNVNGVILTWNRAAQRMFGYSEEEAIGQHITIIIPPELRDQEADILRRLRAGERIEHFETRRLTRDGRSLEVSLTISPVRDGGGAIIGASKILRDITERKKAQAALRELEIAGQVQARLFPQKMPQLSTLDYQGVCIPARHVGGDYYDFLDLGHERFGLVIADVAGKGISGALLMANLQASLRSQCAIASEHPERFLRSVNHQFYENSADCDYATFFFTEYDDTTRRLRYANCGHLSPLLLHRDHTIERLQPTSTVLGLFEEWDCSIEEKRLSPGDSLVLYTDGITESASDAGEEFGVNRLCESLRLNFGLAPEPLVESVIDEVHRFSPNEQRDDITIIVANCR